jgi:hypothetical protein
VFDLRIIEYLYQLLPRLFWSCKDILLPPCSESVLTNLIPEPLGARTLRLVSVVACLCISFLTILHSLLHDLSLPGALVNDTVACVLDLIPRLPPTPILSGSNMVYGESYPSHLYQRSVDFLMILGRYTYVSR